jgi:copper chaperone CopZ
MKNKDCCKKTNRKKSEGLLSGLLYGLLPHTVCIAFVVFTILGVTAAASIFKPLLMNRYFFYGLILLSLIFATISASIYLKRLDLLSIKGIKKKWKYLSVLYGTSIAVNLLLFMVIFPITVNLSSAANDGLISKDSAEINLKVDIPCPGHAPLITDELKKINGVVSVKFSFPDYFNVTYDSKKTNEKEILSLDVFKTYKAEKVN